MGYADSKCGKHTKDYVCGKIFSDELVALAVGSSAQSQCKRMELYVKCKRPKMLPPLGASTNLVSK